LIAENLFELVRHYKKAFARGKSSFANCLDQPQAARPQLGYIGRAERFGVAQCVRQVFDGRHARPRHRDTPS
jgi:hypothetical protein